MKRKIMSTVLASLMILSSVPISSLPVFATNDDSDITVSKTSDDIQVTESESNDGIDISGDDSGITIDKSETSSSSDDIKVEGSETNTEDTADIKIEDFLTSSAEYKDSKKSLNTGDVAKVHVKAENKSEQDANLKVYFCNTDTKLSEDKTEWSSYLQNPALEMSIKDLKKDCTLEVSIVDKDGNETKTSLKFLKEVKDDKVLSRYAVVTLPAGASTEFDVSVTDGTAGTVSVIPVMEQTGTEIGDAATLTWEENITFLDKVVNFFTKSDKSADIQISDVQGVEKGVDDVSDSDFASNRLVVMTDIDDMFTDKDSVIGHYGNIYLLQYDTVANTKEAYARLKDKVTAVEPDKDVTAASNEVTATLLMDDTETETETSEEQTSEDVIVEETTESTSEDEETETEDKTDITVDENTDNAIAGLNDMEDLKDVQKAKGVIALIDTGVSESDNVINRVSMIDDVLEGNGHGDKMLSDIVSQDAEAKVLSIRAMNDNGFGTISSLVAGMEYAIEQKVDYINLSLYARTTLSTSVLEEEIVKATKAGITVVGAAGNDGADVKDYVPGSVEEAYIIGAAKADGSRETLSNFGATVDYNVVAESTSDATALFTGYISANGLDKVADVLNKGLIYETNYKADDIDVDPITEDTDLSKYKLDKKKSVIVKYSFAYADKLAEDDTLMSIYSRDDEEGKILAMLQDEPEVYSVGDGTYKFKANVPMLSGVAVSEYQDVEFAQGNDDGYVITEGCSLDKKTGIVTVSEEAMEKMNDDDFSNMQVQVLVPVNGIPDRIIQDVTVVNSDGSEYSVKAPVYGMQIEDIPLSIEGKESELTSDDFTVYINGQQTPVSTVTWDKDNHLLGIPDRYSALVNSVKIVVKKDVDSVFKIALPSIAGDTSYRSIAAMFYLKEGTNVSSLTVGKSTDANARIGHTSYLAYGYDPNGCIGTASQWTGGDGDAPMGMIGMPTNLFGINFQFYNASGTSYGNWDGYNRAIRAKCYHIAGAYSLNPAAVMLTRFQIIDTWNQGNYKMFAMTFVTHEAFASITASSTISQHVGGVVVFAVKSDTRTKLTVSKKWNDHNNKYGTRPDCVRITLYRDDEAYDVCWLSDENGWKYTWSDMLYSENDHKYSYRIEEDEVDGYTLEYSMTDPVVGGFEGTASKGFTASVTNTLNIGYLKLHKSSSLPNITDGNSCYNLSGAEYKVYNDEACTELATYNGSLITDENGDTGTVELEPGDYWVKETKTTDDGHYELDYEAHYVSVTPDNTTDNPALVEVTDVPGNDPAGISVTKIWHGEKTATVPPLDGTQFTICYYAGEYEKNTLPSTPTRKWVIEVKYEEDIAKYMAALDDYYLVSGSSALYKDEYGTTVLPYGTYTIQETKAAAGYTLEGMFVDKNGNTVSPKEVYVSKVLKHGDTIKLAGGNEYSSEDTPKSSKITLKKYDTDGKTPLAGAKFELKNAKGEVVATKTSDSKGVVEFTDLYPDIYTVTELKTSNNYALLKEPITVKCPMTVTEQDIKTYNIDKKQCVYDDKQGVYYIFNQTYNVTNDANFVVPMTGGVFTPKMLIPLGAGLVVMAGALFISLRKKRTV